MQEPIFMVKEEIIECLKRLGNELEKNFGFEEPVRILMIGGAYMITQIGNRAKTEDVDVLAYIDRNTDIYEAACRCELCRRRYARRCSMVE